LLWCGVIATLAHTLLAIGEFPDGTPVYLTLVATACAAYIVALVLITRSPAQASRTTWIVLALALVMRLPPLFPATGPGSDIFRYVWDARVQREGHNPYAVTPADPGYAAIHTPDTRLMHHTHIPSPYPPAAQLFFRLVAAVSESPRAFKAAAAAADLGTCLVLLKVFAATGRPQSLLLIYAWHPLVALEGARNGHFDAVGALLLVSASFALLKGRAFAATLAFVTAVSLKFLPAVLAPLFWRRIRVRDAAAGVALLAALYWPFVGDGVNPIGSLPRVINRYRFNGPAYEWLSAIVGPWAVAWIAVAAGLIVAAGFRLRGRPDAPAAWGWPMAVALALAPLVHPWYLVWFVPFLTTRWTMPLLVWSITILPVYLVWAFPPGSPWAVPGWLLAIEYGAIAATAIVIWATRGRRPSRRESLPARPEPPSPQGKS
jgi:hypothetical protein